MSAPESLTPANCIRSGPALPAFSDSSRRWSLQHTPSSYVGELNQWAQHVHVQPVKWDFQPVNGDGARQGFWAYPIFPDLCGQVYQDCIGSGQTKDDAQRAADECLYRYKRIDVRTARVRYHFFTNHDSKSRTVNQAIPVVYGPGRLINDYQVLGFGESQRKASENSARKLLDLGWCLV